MGLISFHPLAERELNDTTRYYNLESPGLGRAFLDAVRRTCASITEHPQAGAAVVGTIRRRLIRRGTHSEEWMGIPASNATLEFTGVNVDRVVDGRIVEHGGAANLLEPMLETGIIRPARKRESSDS